MVAPISVESGTIHNQVEPINPREFNVVDNLLDLYVDLGIGPLGGCVQGLILKPIEQPNGSNSISSWPSKESGSKAHGPSVQQSIGSEKRGPRNLIKWPSTVGPWGPFSQ